jgi:ketosteroid isomerase-like protein
VGNADIVRRGFAILERAGVEAIVDVFDPDFEAVIPPELSAEPDTYRGADGLRRYFAGFEDSLEGVQFVPEDYAEVGDKVIVTVRLRARGVGSGIPVEQTVVQVWSIRDGRALRVEAYRDLESARRAAGA